MLEGKSFGSLLGLGILVGYVKVFLILQTWSTQLRIFAQEAMLHMGNKLLAGCQRKVDDALNWAFTQSHYDLTCNLTVNLLCASSMLEPTTKHRVP